MTRTTSLIALLAVACAHVRTAEQEAQVKRGDCAELLLAADAARAERRPALAADLASACSQEKLTALVAQAPVETALLWCGRARAAAPENGKPACESSRIAELASKLNPHLTLGPPDSATEQDPLLKLALANLGPSLNLSWSADEPDVIVGRLVVTLEHDTSATSALVADGMGKKQRVPAVQHRFVARAEAQVELGSKTRTLRASEEARDTTWEALPSLAIAARFTPAVPAPDELKLRAAQAWLRALAKALAGSPPEGVDVKDAKGCVAYGLSLNLSSGDAGAAAAGNGDPLKVAACEKLLGEPAGAGIPVP